MSFRLLANRICHVVVGLVATDAKLKNAMTGPAYLTILWKQDMGALLGHAINNKLLLREVYRYNQVAGKFKLSHFSYKMHTTG